MKPVSIIVNTLNRADYLRKILESFCYLDYGHSEVIVVNGPSTDESDDLLRKWDETIKIGECPDANLSMSRNIGIALAAGEFVAFIDDDAIPEPEWLNQAMDAFERDGIGAVGGPVYDHTGYTFQSIYVTTNRFGDAFFSSTDPAPHNCYPGSFEFPHLAGGNVVFRRSALLDIGGFDEEFQYYLDETDVCLRLVDAGYDLRQLSNSFVHHKWAPSQIRDHKVPKYRFPILKSKAYFTYRHAGMYCRREQLENEINKFVSAHRNEMIEGVAKGLLTDADVRNYEDDVVEAIQLGKEAAGKPPKLMASEVLPPERAPFKRFEAIRCSGRRLTIVYLCDNEDHLERSLGKISMDKAREIAESGHKVHVLVTSSNGNTVDFEHGIWVHRIASKEVEKTDKAIELEISDAAWCQSKAFLDELDRISLHRSIDVVHSALTRLSGAVALLSNKYCLVTSLSPDDVAAIKRAERAWPKKSATHDNVSAVSRRFVLKQSHGVFVACSVKDKALSDLNDYINTRATVISCANSTEEIIHDYVKILDNKKEFVQFKLSIIIPVYNSEKYLHACLRPVLDQVDEGVELIAIDDASEDNSLDILNYYCKRNANIKVLHNDINLGPGPSRNYGLSQASGEYIAFLDSDDSVNESYFNEMLSSAEVHQSDIVFSNVDPEIPVFNDFSKIYAPVSQSLDNLPAECKMTGIIGKLYRREFLREHNIHFLEKKTIIGEDIPFTWISYFCAKKISFAPSAVYRYRMHGAGCDSVNDGRLLGIFDALEYVKSVYEEKDPGGERETMIVHIIVSHIAQNYVKLMTASEPDSDLIQRYRQRAKTLMTFPVELVLNNAFIEQYAKDFYIELGEEYKSRASALL